MRKSKVNVTMLLNATTRKAIRSAMANVGKLGWSVDHVRNRKGSAFIAVRYGIFGNSASPRFQFLDSMGLDITEKVRQSFSRQYT